MFNRWHLWRVARSITYTISEEYYTKFKFIQFQIVEEPGRYVANPRTAVALVGFMASWWVGIPLGLVIGLVALIYPGATMVFRASLSAFTKVILIISLGSLVGAVYGILFTSNKPLTEFESRYIPENLVNPSSFLIVGSIHNATYLAAIPALVVAIFHLIRNYRKKSALLTRTQL